MTSARLEAHDLYVEIAGRPVIKGVSVAAEPGEVIGIVGPNGSGKSTLLRALVRIIPLAAGTICVNHTDIAKISRRQLAQTVSAVLQDSTGDFDLLARDVVALGRAPFKRMLQRDTRADDELIERCLAMVDAAHLLNRPFTMMSGGERQRVLIARALAQQPRLLILDEPTNHLDIRHQFEILALPANLGITAIVALHDLNLAAHFCDHLYILSGGQLIAAGTPSQVLTTELLNDVYGVNATVRPHPDTQRAHITFNP
jgi:iron complex transport system ATP-binding protein